MRLRNLLAATAVSALVIGSVGIPAHAATPAPPNDAGNVVIWGDESDPRGASAIPVPGDLPTPVRSADVNDYATGVVTLDGDVRVWGSSERPEVAEAPASITDAATIVLAANNAAVLHTDGRITAWGAAPSLSQVPTELRAKAMAISTEVDHGTGYAVRPDGTLTTWGDAPNPAATPTPADLTDLVDVSAAPTHVLALRADGTLATWGLPIPELLEVPDFGGHKVRSITTGFASSGAVLDDGTIRIWGAGGLLPANQPSFDGQSPAGQVVSLDLSLGAGAAVTADGGVHVWGSNDTLNTAPESLTGKPVAAVKVSQNHAAAVVTAFRDLTTPAITGTAKVGQTLSAAPATFSLAPDAPATGQWYADSAPILTQTGSTLTLDAATADKSISYRTTATRGQDVVTSVAAPVGPVAPAASTVAVTISPASAAVGVKRTATASVASLAGTRTGTVTFAVGSTRVVANLSGGKAAWTLPSLAVGRHSVTATYSGDRATARATSAAATVTVSKASSKVSGKVKVTGTTKKVAKKVTISLTVTSAKGVSPAGKVKVTVVGPTRKTVTVSVNAKGTAAVTLKNVKRGRYTTRAAYTGNTSVSASSGLVKFRA